MEKHDIMNLIEFTENGEGSLSIGPRRVAVATWVPLFKFDAASPVEGVRYFFMHITDDGGEFHTVREYTRHLAYDLYVLCVDGEPLPVPK